VAWHGTCEVEGWGVFEFALGTSFYRRSEEVAMNGITPASNYGEAEVGQGI